MRIIVSLFFKEPITLRMIVNREKIFNAGLLIDALLILLLPPIVTALQIVFRIQHALTSLGILHIPI